MPFDGQFAEQLPIRCLVNLTDLDISENCFAVLPDWIGELTQLVTLRMNSNSALFWIPPSIGKLRNLKRLEVNLCSIHGDGAGSAYLPDEICSLLSLEVLHYYAEEDPRGYEEAGRDQEEYSSDDSDEPRGPALPDAIGMLTGLKELRYNPYHQQTTDAVTSGLAALHRGGCMINDSMNAHIVYPW